MMLILILLMSSLTRAQQKPMLGSQLIQGHPINRGLVGRWLFNEGGGDSVCDVSGNNNTGSLINNTSWSIDTKGSVLSFSGVSQYVSIPDKESFRFDSSTQDFTVATWMRNSGGETNQSIVDKRDGDNDGWCVRTIAGVVWFSLSARDVKGTININDGEWHHVVCVARRSSTGQVYIDGDPDGSAVSISGTTMSTTTDIYFGAATYTISYEFTGDMSDVSIYNRALTPGEIQQLYANPYLGIDTGGMPIELITGAMGGGGAPPVTTAPTGVFYGPLVGSFGGPY